jgi:hypothetical protein
MHQAGPAIFPIDEAKDECHGINSVVDALTLQPLCFTGISSEAKLMSLSRNLASWMGPSGATLRFPASREMSRPVGKAGVNVRDIPHAGHKVVGDKPLKLLTVPAQQLRPARDTISTVFRQIIGGLIIAATAGFFDAHSAEKYPVAPHWLRGFYPLVYGLRMVSLADKGGRFRQRLQHESL